MINKYKRFILFIGISVICMFGFSRAVFAQSAPLSLVPYSLVAPSVSNVGKGYSYFSAANNVGYGLTGATSVGTSTGVSVTESGIATFSRAGAAALSVPVDVGVSVANASIAKAAAKAFVGARALAGPLGLALTAYSLYDAYKNSDLVVCPPPDFFCKYIDGSSIEWFGNASPCLAGGGCSMDAAIAQITSYYSSHGYDKFTIINRGDVAGTETIPGSPRSSRINFSYEDAGYPSTGALTLYGVVTTVAGKKRPAEQGDFQDSAIKQMNADPSGRQAKIYFDSVTDTWKTLNPNGGFSVGTLTPEDIVPSTSPTTIKSSPYVSSPQVAGTQTFTDANGQLQTKTIQQQTTITPSIMPGTSGASTQVNYNVGSTQTTTTTNANGSPTVVTDTTSQTTTPSTTLPTEFPKDYNREATQQAIQKQLEAAGAPEMADQGKVLSDATSKSDTDLAQLRKDAETGQIGPGGIFSWAWTPPIGSCSPASGTVHGYTVAWDICPTVLNIKLVLAWMLGIFTLISVYSELFKSGDN